MDSLQKAKQYTAEIMIDNCVVGLWVFLPAFCGKFRKMLNVLCNKMLKWNSFILSLALSR